MSRQRIEREAAGLALSSGRWRAARDGFLAQLADDASGAAYEGLAQAMWWLDEGASCLEAREAAYRAHRDAGDVAAAGAAAAALAYDSLLFGEGEAVARGWLGRASELLEGVPGVAEHGWLALREAELALATHADPEIARTAAERATEVGRRVGDGDLVQAGTALAGLALIAAGSAAPGMRGLDAAAAAATSGDVHDLMWMGKIMCWMIAACQETSDLTRAEEWCRRVEIVCRRQHLDPLFSQCRIQHSAILIARGTWTDAEADLAAVLERSEHSRRHARLEAVIQLGELRRRQGRLHEAESLLRQAEFDPVAIVSRAHILLSQGRADEAWGALRALLARTPMTSRLLRARLLLPAVRAAVAAGDLAGADTAIAELRETARIVGTSAVSAAAAAATAMRTDADRAPEHWLEAVRQFHDAHLPFEEAESRVGLARALAEAGEAAQAAEHGAIATRMLESLGAAAALGDANRVLGPLRGEPRSSGARGLTARELEVLRMMAAGQTNQQIAEGLVLSAHTVHRHVANILTKLDQPSRAGAAAYAALHGLL